MSMSLQEQQMYESNIKLQNKVRNMENDIRVLVNHIEGRYVEPELLTNIIKSYKYSKHKPHQKGKYDYV